jgi:hypothetical protein
MVSDRGRNSCRPIHSYRQASRSRRWHPGFRGCRGRNSMRPQKGRRRVHRGEWWRSRRSSSEAAASCSTKINPAFKTFGNRPRCDDVVLAKISFDHSSTLNGWPSKPFLEVTSGLCRDDRREVSGSRLVDRWSKRMGHDLLSRHDHHRCGRRTAIEHKRFGGHPRRALSSLRPHRSVWCDKSEAPCNR